jgi:hypothetical protein
LCNHFLEPKGDNFPDTREIGKAAGE